MLFQPARKHILIHDIELCDIFLAQLRGVIDVEQKPIVIHHKIGADNVQNLLHFQIVIVPDAAASARYRIDMAEADDARLKMGKRMIFDKLSERLLQRVGQIFGAALLFLGNNPGSVISTSPGCAVIVMPRTLAAEVRYSCFCTVVKP